MTPRAFVALLAACASCSSSGAVAPDAAAPDAAAEAPPDAPPDAPNFLPYPAGPYGGAVGQTMPDFELLGYPLSRTQRDYTQLPFRAVSLAEVRSDPACSCMVVIWTASNCPWGLMEDTTFSSAMNDDPGLCAAELIAFNIDSGIDGPAIPSPTRADLDDWVSANHQSYPVGLVTESALTAMSVGALPDEPVNFVVRTSDMRIVGMMDGVRTTLGTEARALCNAPHPGVETILGGLAPTALAIDDAYAYVADGAKGLFRVPLGGGSPAVLADASASPGAFALDATNVYFAAGSSGSFSLEQVPKTGGAPTVLESGSSSYDGVAVDASFVYAARSDGVIERIPIGGGASTTLLSGELHPGSVVVDDQNVVFIARDTGEIALVPKAGGQRISGLPPGGIPTSSGTFVPANLVMASGELFTSGPVQTTGSSFYVPGAVQGMMGVLLPGQPPVLDLGGPNPIIGTGTDGPVEAFSCTGVGPCVDYPRGAVGYRTSSDLWTTASPGEPFTNAVAGDASHVYWTTAETGPGLHDGALRRISR